MGDARLEKGVGVNFSEQPASQQWATLKFRGEKFAEVWFKPEGDPLALQFRIPQNSFQIPGMAPRRRPPFSPERIRSPAEESSSAAPARRNPPGYLRPPEAAAPGGYPQ